MSNSECSRPTTHFRVWEQVYPAGGIDYFTKWPKAYALPNQGAKTVAEVLVKEFVCRFGVPLQFHSNQGRNFESQVFAKMCRILGIEKTQTMALHPQSGGMVERMNKTLEAQLSKFVVDHQRDWDHYTFHFDDGPVICY